MVPNDLVFPPIDHENLKILSSEYHAPLSPPPPQPSPFAWISIPLHILHSKLSSFRLRGPIWSFGLPAAALLMSCWILIAIRKNKRTLTPNEARLINIINNKDRKIAKLLHQIAQMNEILIDRHKALAAKVMK
ncbi:hypothetical protein GLYMA_17G102500v4 [Glycine max]|uniref:Uncharacterized protein n=1 Tax=Glycine max TaxID=3847 RepID=K7MKY4_SOYBN|nr:uncharacterized protein LOC102664729 [Glycine max]KAG4942935.1 hypothetical protein JHK85_047581 [Glycine max]KAH1117786.1 hypothetical protein GYH30_046853 [Glycine max]KRH03517.1 hypothetical protein GLYMA_17G102500v4 [Glycine max]|eukprot:XP_006600702.1 uncharacterized protein LOC102664729 [Glycine max]